MINRRYKPECDIHPCAHSILAFRDGKLIGRWESVKLAAEELGLDGWVIRRSIRRVRPTRQRIFFFRYEDSDLYHDMLYYHTVCPEGYQDHRRDKKKKKGL